MKFKTIVITKKKILFAVMSVFVLASAGVSLPFVAGKNHEESREAFAVHESYEDILSEGVPVAGDNALKKAVEKIVGFNAEEPDSIIGEYSTAFGGTTPNAEYAPENGFDRTDTENNLGDDENPLPLPSREEICTSKGLSINNATEYAVNIDEMVAQEIDLKAENDEPLVLIMHTHTTECYSGDEMNGETERNTDENVNVVSVGREIASVLESYGIKTVHDGTYHDYPSYQGSYSRALTTIDRILKQYPSIKVVLDIHRDAFVYSDGSRLRVACEQNGVQTAQVMLVVGTNSMGLWHDGWRENLAFAAKIQNAAEIMYPGMMRPVNLRTERFNEHMTHGSLILEVGSNGNTLEEAKEGGRNVARAIAAALLNG